MKLCCAYDIFHYVSPDSIAFHHVSPSFKMFTEFPHVILSSTCITSFMFHPASPRFTQFHDVSPSFTTFHPLQVSPSFTRRTRPRFSFGAAGCSHDSCVRSCGSSAVPLRNQESASSGSLVAAGATARAGNQFHQDSPSFTTIRRVLSMFSRFTLFKLGPQDPISHLAPRGFRGNFCN